MTEKKQKAQGQKTPGPTPRQLARIAAAQALFQQDFNKVTTARLILDFRQNYLEPNTDEILFAQLVDAAAERLPELDAIISANLSEGWTIERIDPVLRAILRVGIAELMVMPDVPARVVITEYVDVAHAFFGGKEPGMVNGLLDKVARTLRDAEF
ncbi:MAG: transcription antitermination factor NusB [Elstera sp.]|jgi:N utilization substance protein B